MGSKGPRGSEALARPRGQATRQIARVSVSAFQEPGEWAQAGVPPKNLIREESRRRVRTNVDSEVIGGLKIAALWHIKRPIHADQVQGAGKFYGEAETRQPVFGSSRPTISMVQAADLRNRDDLAILGRINFSCDGRVAIQGQVSPRFVVVHEIRSKNSSEMSLVEDDDVVQALSPNRADQALYVRILPGRSPCRDNLFNAHV